MEGAGRSRSIPWKAEALPGSNAPGGWNEPPPALLLKGIEKFNSGHYWECHETLELLWRGESRPVRELYQGILLVGVGFYHLRNGNYSGAVKVLGRGLRRLEGLPEVCQGVRVVSLERAARQVYERILILGPDHFREFDLGILPTISIAPAGGESDS